MESCSFGEVDCSVVKVCILTRVQHVIMGSEEIMVDGCPVTIRVIENGKMKCLPPREEDDQKEELEEGEIREYENDEDGKSVAGSLSSEFLSDEEEEDEESVIFSSSDDESCGNSNNQSAAGSSNDTYIKDSCEVNRKVNAESKKEDPHIEKRKEENVDEPGLEEKWDGPSQHQAYENMGQEKVKSGPVGSEKEVNEKRMDPKLGKIISPKLKSILTKRVGKGEETSEKKSVPEEDTKEKQRKKEIPVMGSPRITRSRAREIKNRGGSLINEGGEFRSVSEDLANASMDLKEKVFEEVGSWCGFAKKKGSEGVSRDHKQNGECNGKL